MTLCPLAARVREKIQSRRPGAYSLVIVGDGVGPTPSRRMVAMVVSQANHANIVLYSRPRRRGFPEGQGRKYRSVNVLLSDILKLREYKIVK